MYKLLNHYAFILPLFTEPLPDYPSKSNKVIRIKYLWSFERIRVFAH